MLLILIFLKVLSMIICLEVINLFFDVVSREIILLINFLFCFSILFRKRIVLKVGEKLFNVLIIFCRRILIVVFNF